MTITRILALALAGIAVAAGAPGVRARQSATVMVGVLENPPFGCTRPDSPGAAFGVRPLFVKDGGDWIALSDRQQFERFASAAMSWTVAFDGTNVGSIRTTPPRPQAGEYWSVMRQWLELAPDQTPPRRVTPGVSFEGWCNAPARPLVTVSAANFADPEAWKPFVAAPQTRNTVAPVLRSVLGTVYICPGEEEQRHRFTFTARDLRPVRAYRNRSGRTIVGLRFADRRVCSEDEIEVDAQSTHWFLLGDQPAYLGTGLQLVDAGDYDADGKSELLFAYSAYNRDGYRLFADDFRKRSEVEWTYH